MVRGEDDGEDVLIGGWLVARTDKCAVIYDRHGGLGERNSHRDRDRSRAKRGFFQ